MSDDARTHSSVHIRKAGIGMPGRQEQVRLGRRWFGKVGKVGTGHTGSQEGGNKSGEAD